MMNEESIRERIAAGRAFVTNYSWDADGDYKTDQQLNRPQPPLVKAPMTAGAIDLPKDFSSLPPSGDFLSVVNRRRSHRVYTDEAMTLTQLSYLLWCTQGVRSLRGRAYATLRTVPSGGARHAFECYMIVRHIDGLAPGRYHYLPMMHQVEFLGPVDEPDSLIAGTLCGQRWAAKAGVIFYYSCVFYRAEWRYGIRAHAPVLIDSGHVTENLYLAATSIGLGGCAIAAMDPEKANAVFGLDGKEETIFYAMPVGTVRDEDQAAEDAFYAFVREEGR